MDNICRACKTGFKTNVAEDSICPDCFAAIDKKFREDSTFSRSIIEYIKSNETLKFEFLETVLSDEKVLLRIGKALLSIKAKEIGLGAPGSLAEFFRPEGLTETP